MTEMMMVQVAFVITKEAVALGVVMAVVLPAVSMVTPVFNELSLELRDSLDIFSHKATSVQIQFIRLSNMIGLSPVQTIIGLTFTVLGVIIYVVIPQLLINQQMGKTF